MNQMNSAPYFLTITRQVATSVRESASRQARNYAIQIHVKMEEGAFLSPEHSSAIVKALDSREVVARRMSMNASMGMVDVSIFVQTPSEAFCVPAVLDTIWMMMDSAALYMM